MNKKYKSLLKNTLLLTLSQFGSKFLAFFLVPLYTDVLSTYEYGVADTTSTTVTLLIYIFTVYIQLSVLKFTIDEPKKAEHILKYGLFVTFSGSISVFLLLFIAWNTNIIHVEEYVYIFVYLLFISEATESLLYQFLRGTDKVHVMAIASIISTLTRLILSIITLRYIKLGLLGYLLSMTLGSFIAVLFCALCIKRVESEALSKEEKKELHVKMIRFSLPVAISQLGWWANNSIDRYIIILLKDVAMSGVYSMSYKIPNIMAMICNIFSQAWGISAIKEFDKNDSNHFFGETYSIYNALLCVSCSGLILINIPISKILFRKGFFEAWQYSSLLTLGIVFSGLSGYFSGIFHATNNNKTLALSTIIAALTNVILNFMLIPVYDAYGASIATAISFFVCWLIRYKKAKELINLEINEYKNYFIYFLIIIQIILEHTNSHNFIIQIIIILTIICIEFNYVIKAFRLHFRRKEQK